MNDEKLILYFYNDGLSDAERREVHDALQSDEVLAARYGRLVTDLSLASETALAPSHMKAQWHESIAKAAEKERRAARRGRFHFGSFFWGTTVTAAIALGVGLAYFQPGGTGTSTDSTFEAPLFQEASVARGARVYLADSRNALEGLDSDADRILIVGRMIEENRLMRRLAQDAGANDIVRVLRAMEPVMVQLADADLDADEARMKQAKLLFEMQVVLTRLETDASKRTGIEKETQT